MLLLTQFARKYQVFGKEGNRIKPYVVSSDVDDIISFVEDLEGEDLYVVVNRRSGIFLELLFFFHLLGKVRLYTVSGVTLKKLIRERFRFDSYSNLNDQLEAAYSICSEGFPKSIGGPRPLRIEDQLFGKYCLVNFGIPPGSLHEVGRFHAAYAPLEIFSVDKKCLINLLASLGDVRWLSYNAKNLQKKILKAFDWSYKNFISAHSSNLVNYYSIFSQAVLTWYCEDIAAQAFSNYRRYGFDYIRDSDEVGFRLGDAFYRTLYQYAQFHDLTRALYKTTTEFLEFVISIVLWAFVASETQGQITTEFLDVNLGSEEENRDLKEFLLTLMPDAGEFKDAVVPAGAFPKGEIATMPSIVVVEAKEQDANNDS